MRCIVLENHNPYFNLATEEFFLKNSTEEIFMLYINDPCIVVGKHQNILSEINYPFVYNNNIVLARRISGGGAVYQDRQNLNFSFIHNCANLDQMNFNRFTYPILIALRSLGLDVQFSGRNDLLVDTKKISGNAMHIYKTRVLSHGTLLYKTNLEILSEALRNPSGKYHDKSIKSVRSKVTNITNYIDTTVKVDQFRDQLFNIILGSENMNYQKSLEKTEESLITQIMKEKFETWDWIHGYSPKYEFTNCITQNGITINFTLSVEKGIITRVQTNNYLYKNNHSLLALQMIINVRHDFKTLSDLLLENHTINSEPNFNISEFCWSLF